MATEKIEELISKEALAQFQQLKTLTDDNVAAFEKLVARAVSLNKELGSAKTFKDMNEGMKKASEAEEQLIKKSEELQVSLARLQKMYDDQAKKLSELESKGKQTGRTFDAVGDSFADMGSKLDSSGNSFKDAIANLVSLNNQLKLNKAAQKELAGQKDIFSKMDQDLPDVQKGLADIVQREQELVGQEKLLRAEITATNKELRQKINLNKAEVDTREFIKQQIIDLKGERDLTVNINTADGLARLTEINNEIDRLNKILEQTADGLEQRKINIGNYPGAAKIIVDALEKAKVKTEQLTAALGPLDPATQAARRELDALSRVTENPGFLKVAASAGDATRELRQFSKSLIELERAGLGNSQVAIDLRGQLASLQDQVSDTRTEIKALASDSRAFDLFAGSVNFLADTFQTAAGAIGLFSDSEEEVQEITKNLVAVQAISNGIKGIANELTTRGTAANKAYAFTQNLVATATNKSAAATARLGAALKLLGIGLFLAAIAGLVYLYTRLIGATERAREAQNKLNDAMKDYNEVLVKINQELGKTLNDQTQGLRDQLAILEKQGANAYQLFQLKKQIAEEDKKNALEGLRDLGLTAAGIDRLIIKQDQLNERLLKAQDFRKRSVEIGYDKAVEQTDGLIESLQKEIGVNDALIKQGQSLVKTYQDSAEGLKQLNAEEAKFSADDRRKAAFEANKRILEDIIDINGRIVSDERNSLQVRLIAIERIGQAQRQLIEKQRDFELADTSKTELQKRTIRANAGADIVKLERNILQQIAEERRKFEERQFAAQYETLRKNIETNAQINQQIADNENKSLTVRLENNKLYFDRQKALINGQRDFELRNKTLTENERKAIQERANNDLLLLQIDFLKKSNDIANQGLEKELQQSVNINNRRRDILLENLAAQRQVGLIDEEDYQKKKFDIEFKYAQSDLEILVNGLRNQIDARKKAGEDVSSLEAQLAEYLRKLREDDLAHTKETEEKKFQIRMERLQKISEISANIFGVIAELSQIQYDTEKVRIEEEIANIEKRRDAELAAINASAISEQEKADKIQLLEAKTQAQKEQQERRLKQLEADRAKFERATTIQRIIADTAAAIVAALGAKPYSPLNIALAATVGALGAAQLARVVATPLPRFAQGTDDAPGGLSVLGDAGRSELVKEPSGKMWVTPKVPTVMNVPKHSIVYPDARMMLESGLVVNRHGRLVESGTDTSKIEQKLDRLIKVTRNRPTYNMNVDAGGAYGAWSFGANWITYVDDSVRF